MMGNFKYSVITLYLKLSIHLKNLNVGYFKYSVIRGHLKVEIDIQLQKCFCYQLNTGESFAKVLPS